MIKAGIIGGAGYTGGELIRVLVNHPAVELAYIHSKSNAGNPVYKVHQDLVDEANLVFTDQYSDAIDVLFLCTGHGEARKFMEAQPVASHVKVIDLSNDFRLQHQSSIGDRQFVYGLPELQREEIRQASNIANPGCFATAIQLGLLPLAKAGLLDEIYTTGITGSTGAGQGLSTTSHFSWRANNIQAYKTLTHQHLGEIGQSLLQLQGDSDIDISFVPWRGDFTRGIFISSTVHCDLPKSTIDELYQEYYQEHPFTVFCDDAIFLKQVVNTNKCVVQVEKVGAKLVIHSAIDNLLKGASGQAVQNMNLMMGLDESLGLKLKAAAF
ncbi:N-acetyl-gamma-glutamyl-phosphate reductase [Flavihumibacter rivuli]|uniref:N-acetyl-gamma-glutamyl-phosphate reductase n=1 Tax=Flavihumibacter rivuli TaxID=2838156 RepID=UPI001BDE412A|nr:N-acetyl-gamma-glutamyl-phosphate reductase [Flavihumibacter rivuli]ULQ56940.1 N-acetyl-gamma-glutamyl-phosphate reductase [Flavihumibacter rivuli]